MATPAGCSAPSRDELNKRTVLQLKELCEEWGLPRGGNKSVLLARLVEAGGPKSEGISKGSLVPAIPLSAGPWMQKCVKTWKLLPPYNTTVSLSAVPSPARMTLSELDKTTECVRAVQQQCRKVPATAAFHIQAFSRALSSQTTASSAQWWLRTKSFDAAQTALHGTKAASSQGRCLVDSTDSRIGLYLCLRSRHCSSVSAHSAHQCIS